MLENERTKPMLMSDDKSIKGPQDAARINIHEDYEVQYWTRRFNCTKEQLIEAVTKVGVSVQAVEDFLNE